MSEKRCYTVKELQAILGVSRPSVYELLKKDVFRSFIVGGKHRSCRNCSHYDVSFHAAGVPGALLYGKKRDRIPLRLAMITGPRFTS